MSVQSIGMPVRREEDFRLLRGRGRYVDDVRLPREARGYVVRSPHAHARIVSLDAGAARAAPGVLAVLTGDDLKARGLGTLRPLVPRRRRGGRPAFVCPQPILAQDYVRYVGDPVAFVVAETLDQAKDAAELLAVEYETLPAVTYGRGGARPRRACGVARQPGQRGASSTRPATRRRSTPPSPGPTASSAARP